MKHIVSISLGSSSRDKRVETEILGQPIVIERIGTDGDQKKAREKAYDVAAELLELAVAKRFTPS